MNTEMRWLPTVWEDKELQAVGPAVRDLEDAQSWCQQNEDMAEGGASFLDFVRTVPGNTAGSPVPFGAHGNNEVDYEIMPVEVQV